MCWCGISESSHTVVHSQNLGVRVGKGVKAEGGGGRIGEGRGYMCVCFGIFFTP